MECEICHSKFGPNGMRLGVCFDCAEAESVILDGTDMSDNIVASTAREKLEWLFKHNPRFPTREGV